MKQKDIKISSVYAVKVSGKIAPVRVTNVSIYGGWDGRNVLTGRAVRLKTAGRLRHELTMIEEPVGSGNVKWINSGLLKKAK